MKSPKLKNALLCRILTYVIIIGLFVLPVVIIFCIKPVPDFIKIISLFAFMIGLLVYIFRNFPLMMALDMGLACIHCHNTARTVFTLPKSFSEMKVKEKIKKFGKSYQPANILPRPDNTQYKFCSPVTVYTCGIEKVLLSYDAQYLDKSLFDKILSSAHSNSNLLKGKKKARFLDANQKDSPINRVTVAFIFAKRVDEELRKTLYKTVCGSNGDGDEISFLPCVIDLENNTCVFNSLRHPYVGFGYPAINRGIRIIKRTVFGGSLSLADNNNTLEPMKDFDTEQSLWDFWSFIHLSLNDENEKDSKRFKNMNHGEVFAEEDCLYVKWEERGVLLFFEIIEETKTVEIEDVDYWYYPKMNPVAKKTSADLKEVVGDYFSNKGYSVKFIANDDK